MKVRYQKRSGDDDYYVRSGEGIYPFTGGDIRVIPCDGCKNHDTCRTLHGLIKDILKLRKEEDNNRIIIEKVECDDYNKDTAEIGGITEESKKDIRRLLHLIDGAIHDAGDCLDRAKHNYKDLEENYYYLVKEEE